MKTYNSIKDLQKNPEIKEILEEKQRADSEYYKHKKKKTIIIVTIIILFIALFQIFIKEIHIINPLPYDHGYGMEIKIDNKKAALSVVETKYSTIIPFFLTIDSLSENIFTMDGENYIDIEKGKSYQVSINIHECYAKNMKNRLTKCLEPYANYELKNIEVKKWYINISNGYDVIYDGPLSEIKIDEANRYYCNIYTNIGETKVEAGFSLNVK